MLKGKMSSFNLAVLLQDIPMSGLLSLHVFAALYVCVCVCLCLCVCQELDAKICAAQAVSAASVLDACSTALNGLEE